MNLKVLALRVGLFAFPHIDLTWQAFDDEMRILMILILMMMIWIILMILAILMILTISKRKLDNFHSSGKNKSGQRFSNLILIILRILTMVIILVMTMNDDTPC